MEPAINGLYRFLSEAKGNVDKEFITYWKVMDIHELSMEQRNWLMILCCTLTNFEIAWVFFEAFPDFENIDFIRFRDWANIADGSVFTVSSKKRRENTHFKYEEFQQLSQFALSYEIHRNTTFLNQPGNFNYKIIWGEMQKITLPFDRWKYLRFLKYALREDIEPRDLALQDEYNKRMYKQLSKLYNNKNVYILNRKVNIVSVRLGINFLEFQYLFTKYFHMEIPEKKENENLINTRQLGLITNFNYFKDASRD